MYISRRTTIQTSAWTFAATFMSAELLRAQESGSVITFGLDREALKNSLVQIKADKTVINGFTVNMDGKQYVLANSQQISGHHRFTLETISGTPLQPSRIELSTTKDIARIQVKSPHGLDIVPSVSDGDPVTLAGYDNRQKSITELSGNVQNAKGGRFDLSELFDSKNSGCPMMNKNGQVCGITSTIDYYKSKDSEWINTARNFTYLISETSWFSPNWKQYDKTFGRPLRNADEFRNLIYSLATTWQKNLKQKIEMDKTLSLDIQRWIRQHNGMINKIDAGPKKGGRAESNKFVAKDFSDSCAILIKLCSDTSKKLSFLSEQNKSTPFLTNQFKWRSLELKRFANFIKAFEKKNERKMWL